MAGTTGTHPDPWWVQAPKQLASFFDHVQRQLPSSPQLPALGAAPFVSITASTARPASSTASRALPGWDAPPAPTAPIRAQLPAATTKADLGRATWVLLHTLAAQFPEQPSRQQRSDAKTFITSLAKVYPCGECAEHFQQAIRSDPPDTASRAVLQQWMCRLHNSVNRRIGKPTFNCAYVAARWAPLDCGDEAACDMQLGSKRRR